MNTEREIDQLHSSYEIMFDDESGSFKLNSVQEDTFFTRKRNSFKFLV